MEPSILDMANFQLTNCFAPPWHKYTATMPEGTCLIDSIQCVALLGITSRNGVFTRHNSAKKNTCAVLTHTSPPGSQEYYI